MRGCAGGGSAYGYRAGVSYYDVGTMDGYLEAMRVLSEATLEHVARGSLMSATLSITREEITKRITELGDWFHNIDLGGVQTAPHHFLGDYPTFKWRLFEASIPADLTGKTVLDIGCNGGFYSIQMKTRGAARVVAIDSDPGYLEQARFAAQVSGVEIDFRLLDVYQRRVVERALRYRALHGRPVPPAASAAGAGSAQ